MKGKPQFQGNCRRIFWRILPCDPAGDVVRKGMKKASERFLRNFRAVESCAAGQAAASESGWAGRWQALVERFGRAETPAERRVGPKTERAVLRIGTQKFRGDIRTTALGWRIATALFQQETSIPAAFRKFAHLIKSATDNWLTNACGLICAKQSS